EFRRVLFRSLGPLAELVEEVGQRGRVGVPVRLARRLEPADDDLLAAVLLDVRRAAGVAAVEGGDLLRRRLLEPVVLSEEGCDGQEEQGEQGRPFHGVSPGGWALTSSYVRAASSSPSPRPAAVAPTPETVGGCMFRPGCGA